MLPENQVPSLLNCESIFHSYVDNSLAAGWIADEDGHLLFMNKLARQIWHIDENYRLKHMYELFPKHIADEFLASDRQVLITGQAIAFVAPSIRINGLPGFYMVHKYILPVNTSKRLVVGQAFDISDEFNVREELRKSNERFSYVAKAVSDCIWDWDIETGQVYRSEALMALTGYTPAEVEGTLDWWGEKVHPKDRVSSMNKLYSFIKQGDPYCDAEYRFRCADKSYKYFYDKGYIIYKEGRPVRAIGVVHDITEKKKLEAKILRQKVQKQKAISRAVIATQDHVCNELGKELHDNVNQILASANLILAYTGTDHCTNSRNYIDQARQYIQLAIEEIRKVSTSLNNSFINEMGLIISVEEIIATMKLSRNLEIKFEYDPKLEQQLSGEQKLMIYRIIQEQTNNILKYAGATEVYIAIKRKRNLLNLVIRDNGIGFDLKHAKKGNGVINIKNRAETFNGSLNIITAPGIGCTIEVTVPVKYAKNKGRS
jgi:PAS domain S-box-containing protein